MQGYCDEHGLAFRPHIKTHKLPAIAHMQLRAGAVGITCQKLGEAEVMAEPRASTTSCSRSRSSAPPRPSGSRRSRARPSVAVVGDSAAVARGLSPALAAAGAEVGFLVECDTGFARTGVQTAGEAAELARLADSLPGLRFDGLMTYPTLPATGP